MEKNVKLVGDIVDVLNLRSFILYGDDVSINDLCDTNEEFICVIYDVVKLLSFDDGDFALLSDEITDKLYKLVNSRRFEIREEYPEEYNVVNEIIICLNRLKSIGNDELEKLRDNYLNDQAKKRNLLYYNYESFLDSLGVDSFVIDRLNGDELPEEIPKEFIIGSINYLSKVMPHIYEIDCVRDKVEEILDEIKYNSRDEKFGNTTDIIKKMVLKR